MRLWPTEEDDAKKGLRWEQRMAKISPLSRLGSVLWGSHADTRLVSPPPGWPNKVKPEHLEAQPQRVVVINDEQDFIFRSNFVRSSRYTPWTFLPLFLYESFHPLLKGANFYFLVIALLQTVDEISNTNGAPTMLGPIFIVVLVDGIMAVLEDMEKHQADRIANSSLTAVLEEDGTWSEPIPWMEVEVGEIVRVQNREISPADLLIMSVAEPDPEYVQGVCYVETKSLDGETNLKMRQACRHTMGASLAKLRRLRGRVELNHPNANMHGIDAVIDVADGDGFRGGRRPVSWDNILLRGVTLRNTDWVAGLVLNTGDDTKIVMSSTNRIYKQSRLEGMINRQLVALILLLVLVCTIGALGAVISNVEEAGDHWYLFPEDLFFAGTSRPVFPTLGSDGAGTGTNEMGDQGVYFVIMFFYYFLLFSNFIPISLYVSLAVIKSGQAYFMTQDLKMYSEETDRACQVKNMRLNEELGQVSHIFSDKTGTLTRNVMDFRKCIVGAVQYGRGTTSIGEASAVVQGIAIDKKDKEANELGAKVGIPHVAFWDPAIWEDLDAKGKRGALQAAKLDNFFRVLSVCHTVTAEKDDDGGVTYSASSPDDEALVYGAKYFGYYFCDRREGAAVLRVGDRIGQRYQDEFLANGDVSAKSAAPTKLVSTSERPWKEERYEILEILEFSSARKRMSLVVRNLETKRLHVWAKGADSTMKPRLRCFQTDGTDDFRELLQTNERLEVLAEEGLRTLLVAGRELRETEFAAWSRDYAAANGSLEQIKLRKAGEANDIERLMDEIERDLELYGATAIEDRLQEDVPDTIATLMKAGIKVWVLTGDKEETAINIGRACQLVKRDMSLIVVNEKRVAEAPGTFAEILDEQADDIEQRLEAWHEASGKPMSRRQRRAHLHGGHSPRSPRPRASTLGAQEAKSPGAPGEDRAVELPRFSSEREGSVADTETRSTVQRPSTSDKRPSFALVVDGMSLSRGLTDVGDKEKLLRLALLCDAVVACRVSPRQKMEIVKMVCEGDPEVLSLAIGDGANDVAMIKAAHVGVGISGQEGMQAVNNSDFAISQFRFLRRLMMVQGRYNYRRVAKSTLYIFYKNLLFTLCNFWMAFFTLVSGQKFLVEMSVQLYNVVFTCLPVFIFGIWDRDVKDTSAMSIPSLYTPCIHNAHFNLLTFWRWIFEAVLQSLVITYMPMWLLGAGADNDGNDTTLWVYGAGVVTLVVWTANLKLFMHQNSWTWWQFAVWLFTVSTWYWAAYVYQVLSYHHSPITRWTGDGLNFVGVFTQLMSLPNFWLIFAFVTTLVWFRDFAWRSYTRMFRPSVYMVVQEIDHHLGDPKDEDDATENLAFIQHNLSRAYHAIAWRKEKARKEERLERQRSGIHPRPTFTAPTVFSAPRASLSPGAGLHIRQRSGSGHIRGLSGRTSPTRFFSGTQQSGLTDAGERAPPFALARMSSDPSIPSPPPEEFLPTSASLSESDRVKRMNSMRGTGSAGFAASYDEPTVRAERHRILSFRRSAGRVLDTAFVSPIRRLSNMARRVSSDGEGRTSSTGRRSVESPSFPTIGEGQVASEEKGSERDQRTPRA